MLKGFSNFDPQVYFEMLPLSTFYRTFDFIPFSRGEKKAKSKTVLNTHLLVHFIMTGNSSLFNTSVVVGVSELDEN